MSNEASLWLKVCGTRIARSVTPLIDDPWCRRTLFDAVERITPCGGDGTMWVFPDGSRLIANRNAVLVQ